MSLFRDLTYLEHIKESIDKIQSYTQNLSEEAFQESTLIQDAVVRQFEIIGEATKRLSDNIKQTTSGSSTEGYGRYERCSNP